MHMYYDRSYLKESMRERERKKKTREPVVIELNSETQYWYQDVTSKLKPFNETNGMNKAISITRSLCECLRYLGQGGLGQAVPREKQLMTII